MDLKDRKILSLLDENSRVAVTELARNVGLSRQVVEYRINKLVEDSVILKFITLIDPTKFFDNIWHIYIKLQNLTVETEADILDYLNNTKEVWWIANCSGEYDLIFSVAGNDIFHFDSLMSGFRNRFSRYIGDEMITSIIRADSFPRGYLQGKPTKRISYIGRREKAKIDEKDLRILRIIANDSRLPSTKIAELTGLTARQVIYRIKELERKEIIRHYRLHLNFENMGYGFYKVCFYTQNFTGKSERAIIEWCKSDPNAIFFVRKISPWTFEIEFETKDFKQLNDILKDMRNKFGDIMRRSEITSITEEFKGELNILDLY